jgi:hypothetical protein
MPLFGRRQVEAQVTGVAWTRVVQLEQQAWIAKRVNSKPSGDVRDVEKHTETYWETVTDTQPGPPDADGNPGPDTVSAHIELRTREYYTFEALEWCNSAAPRAQGYDQDGVAWPEYELEPGERVKGREETYSATFSAGDKQYEKTLSDQEWRALTPGGSCRLTLGLLGGVKKVAPAA